MATKSYTLEKMQKIHLTILFLTDCIPKFFGNTGLFRTQKIFSSKKKNTEMVAALPSRSLFNTVFI